MSTVDILRIAWEKVDPDIQQGIADGIYKIYNGVVRDETDPRKVILKHLPLEPLSFNITNNMNSIKSALQHVQNAQLVSQTLTVLSTASVIGTVIMCTKILENKIVQLHKEVAEIRKDLNDQNYLFYSEKITTYLGIIAALQETIEAKALSENSDYALLLLAQAASTRNTLYSLMQILITTSDSFSLEHKILVIDFLNYVLDFIPKAAFIESQTAYKLERFALGDSIRKSSSQKYTMCIASYKKWTHEALKDVLYGESCKKAKILHAKFNQIEQLVMSQENTLLLQESV